MVSPDHQADQALYKVGVALRLVDRLLGEFDVEVVDDPASLAAYAHTTAKRRTSRPSELTGRVAHALMLAEELGHDHEGGDQLRKTLRGLLIDLERRPPRRQAV